MSNEVINTVQVQAAAGRSEELGKQLQRLSKPCVNFRAVIPIWLTAAPRTATAGTSAPAGNRKRPCNRISTALKCRVLLG